MARPADLNSKRQRGFRMLNRLWRATAATRIAKLMSELDVDRPYAETIIATHRRAAKKAGKYVTTYRVIDQREGKPCSPHLSSHDVYKAAVKKKDCLTPAAAKAVYMKQQQAKINLAKGL
jgi:hypothetical protein